MKKKEALAIVKEMRECVKNGVPWSLTFKPCHGMTEEQKVELEKRLKESYDLWSRSWILRPLDKLESMITGDKAPDPWK